MLCLYLLDYSTRSLPPKLKNSYREFKVLSTLYIQFIFHFSSAKLVCFVVMGAKLLFAMASSLAVRFLRFRQLVGQTWAGQVFSLCPLVPAATQTITYDHQTGARTHFYERTLQSSNFSNERNERETSLTVCSTKYSISIRRV